MQVQVDIGFDQLIEIVKALPEAQLARLRQELNQTDQTDQTDLKTFLMNGPVFSESQIETITQTRESINQWRAK